MSLCIGSAERRTNHYPESGRGLGHVTLAIFGSTVGYPSDSLVSCFTKVSVSVSRAKWQRSHSQQDATDF